MRSLGLFYFLSRGLNEGISKWLLVREAYAELRRWFRQGVVGGMDRPEPANWLIAQLQHAALSGVDGIAFSTRELFGVRDIETSDGFWSLSPPPFVPPAGAPTVGDVEYSLRYKCMSRIDIFYVIRNESVLVGGVPMILESGIDALRACLSAPRVMRIAPREDSAQCEFSVCSNGRFGVCPLLIVNISYRTRLPTSGRNTNS
jgi:hypothetical protein